MARVNLRLARLRGTLPRGRYSVAVRLTQNGRVVGGRLTQAGRRVGGSGG